MIHGKLFPHRSWCFNCAKVFAGLKYKNTFSSALFTCINSETSNATKNNNLQYIRILHECQVWTDKSVPRVTVWHHKAHRVMPNCDQRDRFVYPYLTRMINFLACLNAAKLDFHTIYLEKRYNRSVRHFELECLTSL